MNKALKDFFYNAVASFVPVVILQIIILPIVSARMENDIYGLALTIIAAISLLPSAIGNILNNVHLLENKTYERLGEEGDFGILLSIAIILCSFLMGVLTLYYGIKNVYEIILIVIVSLLTVMREYYIVLFWIDLNYKKIFICNIWLSIGYVIGVFLFFVFDYWEFIYIGGQLLGLIYILKNKGIKVELFHMTKHFPVVFHKVEILTIAGFLNRSLQYVDRLLLYPLLGGKNVSIYYVSTLVGKIISLGVAPINSYLLSQLAKKENMCRNVFVKILCMIGVIGIMGYGLCIIVAYPILSILYRNLANEAMQYIYITTLTSIIYAAISVISPVLLKFCNINWQITISATCFIVYVTVSLILLKSYQLKGFCFGGLISNLVTICLMILIYFITYEREQ